MFVAELRLATLRLPRGPALWVRRALKSGWFVIEPGDYEGSGGEKCPAIAGATMAGVWHDGRLLAGHPEWGSPNSPSPELEDFAAYFDLCAEELGTAAALAVVVEALRPISSRRPALTRRAASA